MPKKIPYRNQSPTSWWIYSEIEFFVATSRKKSSPNAKHLVWENTRIIQAPNRNSAYQKAMNLGRCAHPTKTVDGEWRFAGISSLLPIYEELNDGAELLWADLGKKSMAQIRRMTPTKNKLKVFSD
jgi:Domain of unknown function (DUF4288)